MHRRSFLGIVSAAAIGASQTKEAVPNRPKVPGTLSLRARSRRSDKVSESTLRWEVAQTAIIICDMWDAHTCSRSAQRVAAMAPRMNQVVSAARSLGVMIIHSPSDTMKFYEGTPWRERMQRAPMAASPTPILARCGRDPVEERNFPIDDSAGGCDDPILKEETGPPYPWTRENSAIDIVGLRRRQRERPGDLQLLQAGRHHQRRPDGRAHEHLHPQPLLRSPADDAARVPGRAGARPDGLDVRSAYAAVRQPCARHRTGHRAHRDQVVPLHLERRSDSRHSRER